MKRKIFFKVVIIILMLMLGVVLLGISNRLEETKKSSYCGQCHPAQVLSWEKSYHGNISCKDCHSKGIIKDSLFGAKRIVSTISGIKDPEKITQKVNIDNNVCLNCHNISALERNSLIVKQHKRYIETNYNCTNCHLESYHLSDKSI